MTKHKIISLFLISSFLLTGCIGAKPASTGSSEPVTINYWRVFDDNDAFKDIITAYRAIHPNVTINYKKLRYDEYETELLDALAEDRGPDIFSLHNTWIRKYQNKIEPMPPTVTTTYFSTRGTLKKEVITEARSTRSISLNQLKDNFIDVVYSDVVVPIFNENSGKTEEKILALPLAADTLAMFYNKDLLNNAGIAQTPKYWNVEFQQMVKKLTKQDTRGQIIQSGVALGGSDNVERSTDILSILMMQNGSQMMSENGSILFNQIPTTSATRNYNPGLQALRFYSDFANPAKEVYSWNKDLENSLEMFASGKLALMFGYSYHLPTIKAKAPKLNFSVAPLPQIEGNPPVNFANYWVETVSKKTKHKDIAWDFIQFATDAERVKSYLDKTNRPTALRSLVADQINSTDKNYLDIFANQVLTAKSWYHGNNPLAAEDIIRDMIDDAAAAQNELTDVIDLGASRVQQTVK